MLQASTTNWPIIFEDSQNESRLGTSRTPVQIKVLKFDLNTTSILNYFRRSRSFSWCSEPSNTSSPSSCPSWSARAWIISELKLTIIYLLSGISSSYFWLVVELLYPATEGLLVGAVCANNSRLGSSDFHAKMTGNSANSKVNSPAGIPSVGENTIAIFLTVILFLSELMTTRSKCATNIRKHV